MLVDYPWAELGNARVIDVGCGPADSGFDILERNPKLTWVLQDLAPMVDLVKTVSDSLASTMNLSFLVLTFSSWFLLRWQTKLSLALSPSRYRTTSNQIRLVVMFGICAASCESRLPSSTYMDDNGKKLTCVSCSREYDDDDAIRVLKNIAAAMKETIGSRMVINEVFCSTPAIVGDSHLTAAPSRSIPHEQSSFYEVANLITWNTYALFGGKERSYLETVALVEAAGLRVTNFYKFRTFTANIECVVQE